jgi:hypothetical protein
MFEFRALGANMYEFTRKLNFDTKDAPYLPMLLYFREKNTI